MSGKRICAALLAVFMVLTLCACGKKAAEPAVTPEPLLAAPNAYAPGAEPTPIIEPTREMTAPVPEEPAAASQEPASAEPSGEPVPAVTPEPTPEPTPAATVVPPPAFEAAAAVPETATAPAPLETKSDLRPGTYVGSDGSVLTVNEDATCTYETTVSGKINGKSMSASLVFHGVYENGGFSFDKVTYGALDLTALAAAAGYTDASPWETAAGIIYGAG